MNKQCKPISISNLFKSNKEDKPKKIVPVDEIDECINKTSQSISHDLQKRRLSYMTKKATEPKFNLNNRNKSVDPANIGGYKQTLIKSV